MIPDESPNGETIPRVDILGVRVAASDVPTVLRRFSAYIAASERAYVCVPDAHLIVQCQKDPALRRILNEAALAVTDGMPLVWVCRLAGHPARRVYGPDLLLAACAYGLARGWRHGFCGGAPGVAEELVERLTARFPGLNAVATPAPPFRELSTEAEATLAAEINACGVDILWVGLGAPKQEFWMSRFRGRLAAPLLVGVGAAFDFHSGRKPQAPKLLQSSGLEWAFRLATEPRRLWPRYREVIPAFVGGLALQALRRLRPAD